MRNQQQFGSAQLEAGDSTNGGGSSARFPAGHRQVSPLHSQIASVAEGHTKVRLFQGLDREQRHAILAAATYRHFTRETVVTHQCDPADRLFLLLRGSARFFFLTPNGKKVYLHWLSQGEIFGAASLLTFPNKRGEFYFTITNGTNYSAGESDRFKDFAARVTLTPFANNTDWLRTLTFSPWYYKGWVASQFAAGGGTLPPISDGVQRDKRGIFVGLKERRLTGGAEFAQRVEGVEAGLNTVAVPRTVTDRTSNLASAFALVRPLEFGDSKKRSNLGLIARWDSFKLNKAQPAAAANPSNTFLVFGTFWDLNARATLALDYQELKSDVATPTFPSKTLFLHWQAAF